MTIQHPHSCEPAERRIKYNLLFEFLILTSYHNIIAKTMDSLIPFNVPDENELLSLGLKHDIFKMRSKKNGKET